VRNICKHLHAGRAQAWVIRAALLLRWQVAAGQRRRRRSAVAGPVPDRAGRGRAWECTEKRDPRQWLDAHTAVGRPQQLFLYVNIFLLFDVAQT